LGLTATPEREDGLTPLIGLVIGSAAESISHQELVAAGHLVLPIVTPVMTGLMPDADDYAQMINWLANSNQRNANISSLATEFAKEGRSTLVLSTRVEHCRKLAARTPGAGSLDGKVAKKRRNDILDRFRSGELRILCATNLADEGLDVSRLGALILALPSRSHGRTIQRIGRLMRPHPGKLRPILIDIVDKHPIAKQQWYARRKAYREALGEVEYTKEVRW
ncbi:MAG: ATP-dependent helicase, partial [Bacteroidetes bacterium]|nr:ATP-dependent helicase [Bacteroidota bacterium]